MTYLPCRACGETMRGIVTYELRNICAMCFDIMRGFEKMAEAGTNWIGTDSQKKLANLQAAHMGDELDVQSKHEIFAHGVIEHDEVY